MSDLILGVDAGGTKTHAALMGTDGSILGVGTAATGNWEHVGLEESGRELLSAINGALTDAGRNISDIKAASFALAGIDWDSDRVQMAKVISGFGLACEPTVMNDAYAVLYAGTKDGVGCASIAGTGGKTVARDGKTVHTTLGMGIGEGGGAWQLISETLRVVSLMHHRQRQQSDLASAVVSFTGHSNLEAMFQAVARDDYRFSADIAPLVFDLAKSGDAGAIEVVTSVAAQHAKDVIGIVRDLNFDGKPIQVVRAGGLHTAASSVFDVAFNSTIATGGKPFESRVLEVVPVVGSLVHAAGKQMNSEIRDHLFTEAKRRDADFRNGYRG